MLGEVDVRERGGFTLVELAIVLVIIGLILGAVLKGRDLIENARIKKIYTHFVQGWELAVLNYQDRTGKLLGDNNGDGWFDNINLSTDTTVIDNLTAVGLSAPVTNTGNPGTYFVKGKYADHTVYAYLYHIHSATDGSYYNAIYFIYMPTDVAVALDTIIDGTADAEHGSFRQYPDNEQWPNASTTPTVRCFYIVK